MLAFEALLQAAEAAAVAVSHGTAWSVYFRDPDGNRLQVFADNPWHVNQPIRFPIDLSLPDDELLRQTEQRARGHPGFARASEWYARLAERLARPGDNHNQSAR